MGDVPTVIAADWIVEMDQCQELVQAKLTGTWIEVAEHLASEGNKYAEALMNKSSTHRTNTDGLRVDYMIVNKQLHSMIGDVEMLESQPLVNHCPFIFTQKISPKPLMLEQIIPTAQYLDAQYDEEQFQNRHQVWQSIDDDMHEAWEVLSEKDDVEHMWQLWNEKSEQFLSRLYPLISEGRPKGTMPATKKRAVTAPSRAIGAETARQKKLRK